MNGLLSADKPRHSSTALWVTLAVGVVLVLGWKLALRPKLMLDEATKQSGIGQPLPALELAPLTGVTEGVSLKDVKGKVTLINYWGPWCGYCVVEFPHLVELWDKYRGNPEFAFLSVSSGADPNEDLAKIRSSTQEFVKARGVTFPTYADPDGTNRQILSSVIESGRGFGYPTTVLLDRAGTIRAVWVGYESGFETEMERLVSKLLAEKERKSAELGVPNAE